MVLRMGSPMEYTHTIEVTFDGHPKRAEVPHTEYDKLCHVVMHTAVPGVMELELLL